MKVNLLLNKKATRSGFLNIDPLAEPGDTDRVLGSVSNLDEFVDDAEIDELVAIDVIDYLPANELDNVLDNWIRKIRHGGSVTVGGVDIREVAKALAFQQIDITTANLLLYGSQQSPCEYRKATLTLQKLIDVFKSRGFKIIQKRLNNYYYHVKAERP